MKARALGGIGLGLAVLVSGCQQSETGEVTFSDYYIKAPVANNQSTGGYITFTNTKNDDVTLTGASVSSDIVEKVELQGHTLQDGVTKMYKVESLKLPAGQSVVLEPGGFHVMFMGLKQSLIPTADIAVTFQFLDGESLTINMPVKTDPNVPMKKDYVVTNDAIYIKDTSARATIPGMDTSAAYMTIENRGEKALSLIEVNSPIATKTELHTMLMEDGMMKMRHIDELDIGAGSEVTLKPGGYHIMLMGLKKPVAEGMEIPVELKFSDGSTAFLDVVAMKKNSGQYMAH